MASINFYLDTRRKKSDGTSLLKLTVTHKQAVRYISLDLYIAPDVWDSRSNRVKAKHPYHQRLNAIIARQKVIAESILLNMVAFGQPFDVEALRDSIVETLFPERLKATAEVVDTSLLVPMFERFAATKKESTRLTYERTLNHIKSFVPEFVRLRFEDVTRSWLLSFDAHMALSAPSPNARAIHMRNLRAVFNFAIDEGVTSWYPFRKYHIKTVKTVKRALSVEQLRLLHTIEIEDWQAPYRDFFMLSFMLIGINSVDLLHLTPSSVRDGRIEYNRFKTSRLYSIKVEPEALALIERLRGSAYLLRFLDDRSDYLQFIRQTNHALKTIGTGSRPGHRGEKPAIFPELTTYWARHTWATIARNIGISIDDIALALGHGDGHDLTHIYLNEDLLKIDEANRRVLDYVFHNEA